MAINHQKLVTELISRWPEHRIAPSTKRVEALLDLLGDPHKACPVIQVGGTNGKGSTASMIDALLRSAGLRTGRFSSPHLISLNERICIDGEPITDERFDEIYTDIEPYLKMVDDQKFDGVALTFFEVMTCLAYAAFADAPVDVAIMEVGLGGSWDATNVADATVSVIVPIAYDHTHILGNSLTEIATEKAGIIKAGSVAVLAGQSPEVAKVLLERCNQVGAKAIREGLEFGLLDRQLAVGGQLLRLDTAAGPIGDLYLPLYGEYMARNAALAVAAVEAFLGGKPLDPQILLEGFDAVSAPARLELVRRSPAVVIDTAHNPHGVAAAMSAVEESYGFSPLIAVIAMMKDKDAATVLPIVAEKSDQVVLTKVANNDRGMEIAELVDLATSHWEKIHSRETMAAALDLAMQLADESSTQAGVLVIGSVYAAGEARALLAADQTGD